MTFYANYKVKGHSVCLVHAYVHSLQPVSICLNYTLQSILPCACLIPVLLCYLGIGLLKDNDSGIKPWMYTCVTVCVVDHLLVPCVMEYLQWKSAGESSVQLVERNVLAR